MSSELVWSLVKNNSSFLVKRNGVQFTAEPGNLTNINSFKYSGLANPRAIDISAGAGGKGVVVSIKSKVPGAARRPAKAYNRIVLDKISAPRHFRKVARVITANNNRKYYRRDLTVTALARWTKLHRVLLRSAPGGIKKKAPRYAPRRNKANKAAAASAVVAAAKQ